MKFCLSLPALALALFAGHAALAQAPAGAPAGSTGQCNDGTYSTAASKSGACAGHKGVKSWFSAAPAKTAKAAPAAAAPAAAPAAATKPAPAPAPAPMAAKPTPAAKPAAAPTTPAAGGGPGMVWVNTSTKVYHCPGDRFYGKTKDGKYMSEADAKAAGARGEKGKSCSK